jgi:hypothetical protein
MKAYCCYKCGQTIIFRMTVKRKDGTVAHYGKPIPIHVNGSCGQMAFPFLKSA